MELYKEEKRLEEKVQKLREMELAADNTEVPFKKRVFGKGYILSEQEYAEFTAEKKAVSVQRADAEQKVIEAEESVRQIESRRIVLSDREDDLTEREAAFEKKKAADENAIREKNREASLALVQAHMDFERAENLVKEQLNINEVLRDTKSQLEKARAESERFQKYKWENIDLKNEMRAKDRKHRDEIEHLESGYSGKIKELTVDISNRDKIISEQKESIISLETAVAQKEDVIREQSDTIATWESLYDNACAVGEYACKKLGKNFKRCLDMKNDNYRLSYIFGDERSYYR